MQVWHKLFPELLNVVIMVKISLRTGKTRHVILFGSDLKLPYGKLIEYYKLRFQIEFNFRDAGRYWGLEDFMNISKNAVYNVKKLFLYHSAMLLHSQQILKQDNMLNYKHK